MVSPTILRSTATATVGFVVAAASMGPFLATPAALQSAVVLSFRILARGELPAAVQLLCAALLQAEHPSKFEDGVDAVPDPLVDSAGGG